MTWKVRERTVFVRWYRRSSQRRSCHRFTQQVTTVGYARTKVIGPRTSFVIASVPSSLHCNRCC